MGGSGSLTPALCHLWQQGSDAWVTAHSGSTPPCSCLKGAPSAGTPSTPELAALCSLCSNAPRRRGDSGQVFLMLRGGHGLDSDG